MKRVAGAIDPAALRRVDGAGVRLCEACGRRESRRAVEAGEGAPAEG